MAKELELTDREQKFVDLVIEYEGDFLQAAKECEYAGNYVYKLRKRLAKHIAEAAQQYIAIHSPKAAKGLVGLMDDELPNPVRLNVYNSILDRAGAKPIADQEVAPTIKANIFILPEKKMIDVTDL